MEIKENLLYSSTHEWVLKEGDKAKIGITDYAQDSLGDIVFVEMPEVDSVISKKDQCGTIESVKAVSDLFTPLSGIVTANNEGLEDQGELINSKPYDSWIFELNLTDESELDELMDAITYKEFCEQEG